MPASIIGALSARQCDKLDVAGLLSRPLGPDSRVQRSLAKKGKELADWVVANRALLVLVMLPHGKPNDCLLLSEDFGSENHFRGGKAEKLAGLALREA